MVVGGDVGPPVRTVPADYRACVSDPRPPDDAARAAMSDTVLAIAAERAVEPVLRRLVEAARTLAGGRYAALGIPDGEGGFAQFLTTGLSDEEVAAIGPLPRTHGLLGAMLGERESFRTADITRDPRFWGWPAAHPDMRSFLGVPILSAGTVVGAIYVTDKEGAPAFTDADQEVIELLAAHAAVAIENVRLTERTRELAVLEERAALARELHDAMTQKLFSLNLVAEAAADAVGRDPEAAEAHIRTMQGLARDTLAELRSLIVDLRPADLGADGLVAALRAHVDLVARVHGVDVVLRAEGDDRLDPERERQVFRVVQEALHNAVRHAGASRIEVTVTAVDGRVAVAVRDDGAGFDPDDGAVRGRRLGLTSMRDRARAIGGHLAIESAPGAGTAVRLEVGGG